MMLDVLEKLDQLQNELAAIDTTSDLDAADKVAAIAQRLRASLSPSAALKRHQSDVTVRPGESETSKSRCAA